MCAVLFLTPGAVPARGKNAAESRNAAFSRGGQLRGITPEAVEIAAYVVDACSDQFANAELWCGAKPVAISRDKLARPPRDLETIVRNHQAQILPLEDSLRRSFAWGRLGIPTPRYRVPPHIAARQAIAASLIRVTSGELAGAFRVR